MSDSAFIDIREIARVEAFWWVGGHGEKAVMEGDWMAIVFRPIGAPGKLRLKYRFRYYNDDRAFHSNDRKSSYAAETDRSKVTEAIDAIDEMAKIALVQFGGEIFRKRFVEGTPHNFQRWLIAQPFAHIQTEAEHDRTRPQ